MIAIPMTVAANIADVKLSINTGQYMVPVGIGAGYSVEVTSNYELLTNKPQINNVELIGNKFLQDLFPDGILINCGDATGYPEPVIPPDVPYAEGVGF
jgi:hypothetical protein